jgi:hypothetical protein
MNKIITAIVLAAATYAVQRFLARSGAYARPRKPQIETWENEGGALAPQQAPLETSQVPR